MSRVVGMRGAVWLNGCFGSWKCVICEYSSLQPVSFDLMEGASHGGSEKPGKLEVGGASRDSTGLGALEEGLISS